MQVCFYKTVVLYIGKDNKEDCTKDGVHRMQGSQAARDQAMQALRVGRRQEEEGLSIKLFSSLTSLFTA